MVKICAVIRAKEGLSREDFLYYWQEEHPAVVRALPGVRRYVQNPAIDNGREWPFAGLAEVYFDSVKDIAVAFSSPLADAMREHEKLFIGEMEWIVATEEEVAITSNVPEEMAAGRDSAGPAFLAES